MGRRDVRRKEEGGAAERGGGTLLVKKGKEEGESELWGSCEVPRYALPSLLPFPPPRTARRRKSKAYPFRGKNRG